jgi:uncharacterized protein YeaO (DUF488 family)
MTMRRKHRSAHADKSRAATSARSSPACCTHELDSERAPSGTPDVRIKRIYDDLMPGDGFRVLVDRIWPRGITKQEAALDAWLRDLAPSTELRKWFGHDPSRWTAFHKRYRSELAEHTAELKALRRQATRERVTLLYGARDRQFNQAVVLAEAICET